MQPRLSEQMPLDFHCMHAVAPEEAANAILELIKDGVNSGGKSAVGIRPLDSTLRLVT
jgi:hypothetical protein